MRKAPARTQWGHSSVTSGDPQHLVWGRPELESSSSGEDLFSPYEGVEGRRDTKVLQSHASAARSRRPTERAQASSSQQHLHDFDASNPSSSTSLTESSDSRGPNGGKKDRQMPSAWAKEDVKSFYAKLKEVAKHTSPTNRTAWDADEKKVEELAKVLGDKDLWDSEAEDDADDMDEESVGEGAWSVGSENHATGQCRPCHYVFAKSGCTNGEACTFCHLPHPKRFRPRPCKSKRYKCKRLASVLDKVFDDDPDSFQSVVDQLSAQGGYLNAVVKSKVKTLQQKTQAPEPPKEVRRVLKPGLVSL